MFVFFLLVDLFSMFSPSFVASCCLAWPSAAFQTAGVKTAPRVFLVPEGQSFPTARNLGEFEVTQGLSRSDGSVDDFLHDLEAITGAKVS